MSELKTSFFQAQVKVSRGKLLFLVTLAVAVSSAMTVTVIYSLQHGTERVSSTVNISKPPPKVEAVAALGYLEPEGEVVNLSAPNLIEGARVEQLLVQVGEWAEAGDLVAVLDNHDSRQADLTQSQQQVKVAQARLEQVEAGAKSGAIEAQKAKIERLQAEWQGQRAVQQAKVQRLEAEFKNAKTECDRYQQLYQTGAIAASDRDQQCLLADTFQQQLSETQASRNLILETLEQQITEAKATLAEIAEVRDIDVAVVKAELEATKARVKQAQTHLDLAYVRSPQKGQILKIHTFPGEIIGNQGIVAMGQTEQMYAIAEVYETDIHKVRLGQKATITSPGFIGQLSGIVDEIGLQIGKKDVLGTDPAADVDARVVEVKIRLDSRYSQEIAGLTNLQVNVRILTDSPVQ